MNLANLVNPGEHIRVLDIPQFDRMKVRLIVTDYSLAALYGAAPSSLMYSLQQSTVITTNENEFKGPKINGMQEKLKAKG